ncbi:MAG: ABC-type multidrug transport system component [Ignavibacteria bacterium]|nr:ABC-type multidrug transport system component [Ignavibacteria bacterium]
MEAIKRLLPYLNRYKTRLYLGFLFVTISNICSTLVPRYAGKAIDQISIHNATMSGILESIAIMLLLTAGSGIFMFATRRTIIVSSRLIEYDLRRDFLYSLELQPAAFFNKNPTGMLMSYINNDISAAREFLGPAVMYAANTITTFFFVLYFMLGLSWDITLISLLPLPLITIGTYFIGSKVHNAFRDVQEQFSQLTSSAQETFSGIRVVRSYLREAFESLRFEGLSRQYLKKNMKLAILQSAFIPGIMLLVGFSLLIMLGYGGRAVIQGNMTLGGLTQFYIYLGLLIWPVAAIGWITNIIQRASASTARIFSIMDSMKHGLQNNSSININNDEKIDGAIELNSVSFKYTEDMPNSLSDVSFKLSHGSSLGITGTIGSGKSTIVNLLTRLYEPDSGNIFIGGKELKNIDEGTLRKSVASVLQDTFIFSISIADNIKFGRPEATIDEVTEAARTAGLHEEILTFPAGYQTVVGERGVILSGGQRQRLALARAILRNPSILILDDAFSAVDTQTEDYILKRILPNGKSGNGSQSSLPDYSRTCIIISHRISTVKYSDNILYMNDGNIVESGSHPELLALQGRYFDTFQRQQLEEELQKL